MNTMGGVQEIGRDVIEELSPLAEIIVLLHNELNR
jgi:hypothetical protein